MNTYLAPIIKAIKKSFDVFFNQISTIEGLEEFFRSRGWITSLQSSDIALIESLINLKPTIENLANVVDKFNNSIESPELIKQIISEIKQLAQYTKDLELLSSTNIITNPLPLNETSFWQELGENLFDDFLIKYIQNENKHLFTFLHFIQVFKFEMVYPNNQNRIPWEKKSIDWDKIGDFLSNPLQLLKSNFNWGQAQSPNYSLLFNILERIFCNYGINPKRTLVKDSYYDTYLSNYTGSQIPEGIEVKIIEAWSNRTNNYKKISLTLIPSLDASNNQLFGFVLIPHVLGFTKLEIPISDEIFIGGEGYFESDNFLSFKAAPDVSVFQMNPLSSTTYLAGKISLVYAPVMPAVLIGHEYSSRLMLNGLETTLEVKNLLASPEFIFKLGLGDTIKGNNFLFAYEPSKGDGFITKILGKKQFQSIFGLGIIWSSKYGIQFIGSGGLEIEIPLHDEESSKESKSPLKIRVLRIGFGISNNKFSANAGVDISFKLGPVSGSINDIGASMVLTKKLPSEPRGILGNLDFDWGFKFPKGVGVSIKSKLVTGAGYLYLDPAKGKYYGAVELNIKDKFHLTAIAIITTKAPDGSEGFSLLTLINVKFTPAIPLSFGFTLNGIGGILGIHRTMNTDNLRNGLKTGTVNHILFPENVIENIDAIIGNLESVFPIEQQRYTFGIFLLLGWGQGKSILELKLGIILSVPDPVKLAVLGDLKIVLPDKEKKVLAINVAFIGIVDFDKQYLSFDATIYNSSILDTIQLYGDMAVRVFWGNQKEMLVTVGGFHPAFSPSASLMLPKDLKRLGISLIDADVQGIRLKLAMDMYFAITSNTVQFGAKLEMLMKYSKLEITGLAGFDVLFHFNPFQFESHVYASLAVKFSGEELFAIGLDFLLNGPGPWYAKGYAEFKLLWWTEKVNFTHTWGAAPNTIHPPADVRKLVKDALNDTNNWVAELQSTSSQLVQLREKQGTQLVIDPSGSLVVTQKVVPLGITIQKFGNTVPIDVEAYKIIDAKFGTDPQATAQVKENFAPAQFRNMSDDEKLKAASFEFLDAGIKFGCNDWRGGTFITKSLNYENTIIDKDIQPSPKLTYSVNKQETKTFIAGGKISECVLLETKNNLLVTPLIQLQQPKYKLVSVDTLTSPSMVADSYNSLAEALDQKEQLIPTALQNLILCKA
jgi:hypothetical protein